VLEVAISVDQILGGIYREMPNKDVLENPKWTNSTNLLEFDPQPLVLRLPPSPIKTNPMMNRNSQKSVF
jgi:hypothetical protein